MFRLICTTFFRSECKVTKKSGMLMALSDISFNSKFKVHNSKL
ncbi:hypothetical protein HMPREF0973_00162 [Prevotella veroralis F0319]|uniref:Uncharacterized protein n=1 Tax=Prevotella veroralis F0319 TaxID=649761 RepID=C9MKN8_9BACT|nr:hypothetical protein HMPREF0973_00162 [Prevotella veroralis F0319]